VRRFAMAAEATVGSVPVRVKSRWSAVFLIAAAAAIMMAFASSAQAEVRYVEQGTFTPGVLGDFPTRVAADQGTGHILVVDSSKDRVVVFADGNPGASVLTTFGAGDLSKPFGIAVDQSNGDVYVSDAGNERVVRYATDGAPTPTYTLDAGYTGPAAGSGAEEVGNFASAIALDPDDQSLLVADSGNLRVSRFDSSGAFVDSFDGADSTSGVFASLVDIALDGAGNIYVIANGGVEPCLASMSGSVVDRFGPDGTFQSELAGLGDARSLAYDPHRDQILVATGGGFGPFNEPLPPPSLRAFSGDAPISSTSLVAATDSRLVGVAVNSGGQVSVLHSKVVAPCISSDLFGSPGVDVLGSVYVPDVTASAATGVTPTSEVLHGTVNPGGEPGAVYHFEYLVQGSSEWKSTPEQAAGNGTSPETVEAEATGLVPNRNYEFRLTASNGGLSNTSEPLSFTTGQAPPEAVTVAATDVTDDSAVVRGSVTSFGLPTTYYFESGTTTGYGSKSPSGAPQGIGSSYTPHPVVATLADLAAATTYHYRVVATNSIGTTFGNDKTFTTAAGPAPARGYEMVSPAAKGGGEVNANFGFQASADGEAMTFDTTASFGTVDAESGTKEGLLMSRRGPAGWNPPQPIDPPIETHRGLAAASFLTLAISDDAAHSFVVSNRKLTPDAVVVEGTGGANLYIRDLATGAYTFVAGSTHEKTFGIFAAVATNSHFIGANEDFSVIVFDSAVPFTADAAAGRGIYRWSSSSGLELVSRLPDGSPATGVRERPTRGVLRTVSSDASRIVFSVSEGGPNDGVYLWEGGQTRPLSVSHRTGDPDVIRPGLPLGISRDGRYVVFDVPPGIPLTDDAEPAEGNVYRLDLDTGPDGTLDLVAGPGSGAVAMAEDGERVYFAGKPDSSAPVGIYAWTLADGAHFISPNAGAFAGPNSWETSPDAGNYLVYKDNAQVQIYDAVNDHLDCASCAPGGLQSDEAFLPENEVAQSNRYPRFVLDDGRVFFYTSTPLVAADVNDRRDVYGYKDGQASLVSPGTGPYEARFADASADGRDVFFATTEPISSRDRDDSFDVYDARIGGGEAPAQTEAPCSGEQCAGPPGVTPPPPPTATQTTSGATHKVKRHKHHKKHRKSKKKKGTGKQPRQAAHVQVHGN
jgi:sugar lactone lactonase YvrE